MRLRLAAYSADCLPNLAIFSMERRRNTVTRPEQAGESRRTRESQRHCCVQNAVSFVQQRSRTFQAQIGQVNVWSRAKDLFERAMKVEARQAGFTRDVFQRDWFIQIIVQILSCDLQAPIQLIARRRLNGGNLRDLSFDLAVQHHDFLRKHEKVFFEIAGLKPLPAAFGQRPHVSEYPAPTVAVQSRKKLKAGRRSPG